MPVVAVASVMLAGKTLETGMDIAGVGKAVVDAPNKVLQLSKMLEVTKANIDGLRRARPLISAEWTTLNARADRKSPAWSDMAPAPRPAFSDERSRMTAFLQLSNISKSFGGVRALQNIDLALDAGEVHCLVGENGSGKSTLIKIIAGILAPAAGGRIVIAGRAHRRLDPAQSTACGIQVIYQDLSLFPNLTVAENIAMAQHLGAPHVVKLGEGPRDGACRHGEDRRGARSRCDRRRALDLGPPARGDLPRAIGQRPARDHGRADGLADPAGSRRPAGAGARSEAEGHLHHLRQPPCSTRCSRSPIG